MAIANLIIRIAADVADFDKGMAGLERSLARTSRTLETTGRRMTQGLTLPIIAIAGVAAKAAIDFESSFAGVRKTVDATEGQFKELEGAFRDLAKTMPLSVNEINKVAESAGQLGVVRENLVDFTTAMIKLGTATNLTADEAAVGMARFANAMGQPTIDMEKLGSALVALGNKGASTEKDILALALRMAGTGAQIGLTAGEIFGMANALSSVGIEAEKGGSAISMLFKDISKSVSFGGEALKNFAEVAFGSIAGASEKFATLFKDDAAGAITKFVEGLGAIKAAGGDLLPILEQLGITEKRYSDTVLLAANSSKQFAASVKLGNDAFAEGKALNNEYNERLKTTASQLIILKNNLMDAAVTLGQAMLPAINQVVSGSKPLVNALAGLADGFKALPGPIRDVTLAFIALLAAAGPIVFIAGKVTGAWGALLSIIRFIPVAITGVATGFLALGGYLTGTFTGLTGVTGAFYLLRSAALALAAPLAAIPILLVGIVAAAPRAVEGLRNMRDAITTGRFWEFVTTKDAPGIWEKEFWGISRSAKAAAVSIDAIAAAKANAAVDRKFSTVEDIRDTLSGAKLAEQVRDLASAFASIPPAAQRSADTMKRTGAEALRLRDAGAQLTPELDRLANKSLSGVARASKTAGTAFKQAVEEMDREDLKAVGDAIKYVEQRIEDVGTAFDKAAEEAVDFKEGVFAVREEIQSVADRITKLSENMNDLFDTEDIKSAQDEIQNLADRINGIEFKPTVWTEMTDSLKDTLKQVPMILRNAFVTGNWLAAAVDIGSQVGAAIGKGIGSKLGGPIGGEIGEAFGSLLGPLIGKIFGETDYEKRMKEAARATAELRLEAIQTAGGLDRLRHQFSIVGIQIDEAFKSRNPTWIREVLDEGYAKTQLLKEAMEEYGFTWENLGAEGRALQLGDLLTDLKAKTDVLIQAGIAENDVLAKQAEQYSELVSKAILSGTEISVSMKPILEKLRDMGLLTNKATGEFIDLEQVTWAKSLTQGFDQVTKAIYELRDALLGGVGGALQSLSSKVWKIPVEFDVGEFPGRSVPAMAGGGIVRKPTLALVGEAAPEAIIPLSTLSKFGGGVQKISVYLNSKVLTQAVVEGMPAEFELYGI